jgi:anion-transporting  ArsA/GET3 family ATPase
VVHRRRQHIVTGKGGVGKSTVAASLALAAAAQGARVLAIELSEPAGLCRIFGATPGGPGVELPVADRIVLSYFDGAAALAEYLTRKVHLGALLRPVLEHPVYRAFSGAAPGVRELMAIGKVRDEFRRRDGLHHHWDTVVVDAGASGHALAYLRIAGAAARAFSGGRVHRESSRIDELLRDPARTAIHVVATPEEMPFREAASVIGELRGELSMPVGALYLNQCRPPAPAGVDRVIDRLDGSALGRVARVARGWEQIQERGIAELEAEVDLAAVRLPRIWRTAGELERARVLAEQVGEAAL